MILQSPKKQQLNLTKQQKNKHSDHSLLPDLYTGWQIKTISHIPFKQIPLIFAHTNIDFITKTLTSFGSQLPYKVVYMGFRPSSNMKLFKQYAENKNHKIVQEYFLYTKKPFKKFKFLHFNEPEKYFPIRSSEYRLFKGVNPTSKNQDIKFCSQFQGGNLDLAIAVNPNEYDLIMRVDSNTKGHTCWYFFKVIDIKKKKKVRFNIINFTKNHLHYEDGMKPYVFRKSKMEWSQEGSDIEYKNKAFRYFQNMQDQVVQKCLSFTYEFDPEDQEVYFAYSIPYSYSYLLDFLQEINKKYPQFIKVNYGQETTGGLTIPILTITNFTTESEKQKHLSIGRLHPGQSQGSWMMQGLIRYLCSPQAHYLREKVQFKIIPMVNIDGVVIGNFRTGISGRDLNRVFHKSNEFEQIKIISQIAKQFQPQVFLDFHGHSAKKNVFIYGPQYKIDQRDYLMCRLYPKIISKKTEAFRYYACLFKISESKINTGRALFFYEYKTRFVFTIEASTYAYGYKKQPVVFTSQRYIQVGNKIAQSLQEFVKILIKIPKNIDSTILIQSQQKIQLSKNKKLSKKKINKIQQQQKQQIQNKNLMQFIEQIQSSELEKQLIKQILQNQKEFTKNQKAKTSQSDSDCQNQKQDYTDQQLKNLEKCIDSNKNDSIQQLLQSKFKSYRNSKKKYKKIRQKTIQTSKLYTLDVIPKNQLNKSLLLRKQTLQSSKDFIQQKSHHRSKQLESPQKNSRNQKKSENNFYDKMIDCSAQKVQKLKKLELWKSNQLKKYQQIESMNLQRNKSANQVHFQCPPVTQFDRLHKIRSQIASQLKKKQPIFSVKKSFLPSVVIKNNYNNRNQSLQIIGDYEYEKIKQKNLVNQILQLHEKKKKRNQQKVNRKLKIHFA